MAVSFSSLTNGNYTEASSPYVTASVSPSGDVLMYFNFADAASITITSITGCGLTWSQVNDSGTWGDANYKDIVWKGVGTASSGTISVTTSSDLYTMDYFVVDVTGHNTSGMVVQTVTNSGTGTTISATLSAFADSGNATIAFSCHKDTGGITPGTGFTELAERTRGPFGRTMEIEWRNDPDTSPDSTGASSDEWFMTALEIAATGGGGGSSKVAYTSLTGAGQL